MREIDNRPIGKGLPGPVSQLMQERYIAVVRGRVPERHDWLTYVG